MGREEESLGRTLERKGTAPTRRPPEYYRFCLLHVHNHSRVFQMSTRMQAYSLETASPKSSPVFLGRAPPLGKQRAVTPQTSSQAVQPLRQPTKLEVSASGADGRPLGPL